MPLSLNVLIVNSNSNPSCSHASICIGVVQLVGAGAVLLRRTAWRGGVSTSTLASLCLNMSQYVSMCLNVSHSHSHTPPSPSPFFSLHLPYTQVCRWLLASSHGIAATPQRIQPRGGECGRLARHQHSGLCTKRERKRKGERGNPERIGGEKNKTQDTTSN